MADQKEANAGQLNGSSTSDMMMASVDQSLALAIQDATDLMRNVSTIETTVIGIASAKWLADPANVAYEQIINNATQNITFVVENLAAVGKNAKSVISDLSG